MRTTMRVMMGFEPCGDYLYAATARYLRGAWWYTCWICP